MPRLNGVTARRMRGEFYRAYGGVRVKHNGIGFDARPRKVVVTPAEYNSGPTPRHAILDLLALIRESTPEVQDYIQARLG